MADWIEIEVCYGLRDRQTLQKLTVPAGTTIEQAIELSEINSQFPDLNLKAGQVGIFSQKKPLDTVLRAGDRVEIYRPLIADPKEVRRQRAALKKKT